MVLNEGGAGSGSRRRQSSSQEPDPGHRWCRHPRIFYDRSGTVLPYAESGVDGLHVMQPIFLVTLRRLPNPGGLLWVRATHSLWFHHPFSPGTLLQCLHALELSVDVAGQARAPEPVGILG